MEQTKQSAHLPKGELLNLDAGDVAIGCPSGTDALPGLDRDRVAFVTPLDSRAELESVLREMLRRPNIRHLVLSGDDQNAVGDGLLALWKGGLDDEGRVPGPRGRLSPEFDGAVLAPLRAHVVVSDLRGIPLDRVADVVADLPAAAPERGAVDLPDPEIPDRKVFLSRATSFPIFSCDVGDSWMQLLNLAIHVGAAKRSVDGAGFAEALNAMVTIEIPILEDGEAAVRPEFAEFLEFTADDFEHRCHPIRTDRLRLRGGDQLDAVCDRLTRSPDSQAATMVLLDADELADADASPDLIFATFNVVDGRLFASFVLRRCDLYTDWPRDAAALVRLRGEVAKRLSLEEGSATFVIHSATLDERDFERSTRVLKESFLRPLPLHVDPSGVFLFGNDAAGARAMLLNHDASDIFWEDAFEDPEDMSWFIVDVMPWLLPQHIRYVGQECASLMRAMQVGECYLQG